MRHYEGDNDGLLPPESVKWGHFRGTLRGVGKRGVSHFDEIDFRRKPPSKVKGDGVADILDFYTGIVEELAQKGCRIEKREAVASLFLLISDRKYG